MAGCTAFGTTDATIHLENLGSDAATLEYFNEREQTIEPTRVDLAAGEQYERSIDVERGDTIVVSAGEVFIEAEFDELICRDPTLWAAVDGTSIRGNWQCD